MRTLSIRPAAAKDLRDIVVQIAESSPDSAERFSDAVYASAMWLASYPGAGHPVELGGSTPDPRRQFAVRGFRNYLVFYRNTTKRLIVVRVVHGARDLPRVLCADRS